MCFTIFQKEKTSLYAKKTRSLKRRKIRIFPKRLVRDFVQKLSRFPSFHLRGNRPGKCVAQYSRRKKHLSQTIKARRLTSRKLVFSPKGLESMILVKNSLDRRGKCVSRYFRAFLGYKNKKFKKSKNGSFSKGVSPWFWSKSISFSILLFQAKKCQEKVFYHILQRKKVFLRFKIIAN